jgi:hypothetical protein
VKIKGFTKEQVEIVKQIIEEETTIQLSVGVLGSQKKKAKVKDIIETFMLKGDIYVCWTPSKDKLMAYDKTTQKLIF